MSINPNIPGAGDNPALQAQLALEYPNQYPQSKPNAMPQLNSDALRQLPTDEAVQQLNGDPVGFIRKIVDTAAMEHLERLKEQAELLGSLNAFRKAHPDAQRFEPFILQEVARLLQTDSESVALPWDALLEKGLSVFREKFKATLKGNPDMQDQKNQSGNAGAQMESSGNRKLPPATPAFTRKQIAAMSLPEFIAQEEAINSALQNNRIR